MARPVVAIASAAIVFALTGAAAASSITLTGGDIAFSAPGLATATITVTGCAEPLTIAYTHDSETGYVSKVTATVTTNVLWASVTADQRQCLGRVPVGPESSPVASAHASWTFDPEGTPVEWTGNYTTNGSGLRVWTFEPAEGSGYQLSTGTPTVSQLLKIWH